MKLSNKSWAVLYEGGWSIFFSENGPLSQHGTTDQFYILKNTTSIKK